MKTLQELHDQVRALYTSLGVEPIEIRDNGPWQFQVRYRDMSATHDTEDPNPEAAVRFFAQAFLQGPRANVGRNAPVEEQ